jgi:uncharacterized membrane protein YkvA (DUF1232 family)
MTLFDDLKAWAKSLRRDTLALWIAARDPRTPLVAKVAAAAAAAAYALSPFDLIPDFIPVLGYLDDLLIVPLGIVLVVKLIPPHLMAEYRLEAGSRDRPASLAGMVFILAVWFVAALVAAWYLGGVVGMLVHR